MPAIETRMMLCLRRSVQQLCFNETVVFEKKINRHCIAQECDATMTIAGVMPVTK
jgi:hypothetical protein